MIRGRSLISTILVLEFMRFNKGLTLVEIIIYVAFLGAISVFIANFLIQIVNTYNRARAEREVIANARLMLERINKTVSESQTIYSPTSVLNSDAGQLSLITASGATPEHATAYADFWVDNGIMFMRQEGRGAIPLSASSVRVNKFRPERIMQGLGREAVKIILQIDYANAKFPATITLNSTTALKGNY